MPRMKFLSDAQSKQFDSAPEFNAAERKRFFAVTDGLSKILGNLKTPTNQVCFIITLGYFRATKRFFVKQFHDADVRFVATRLGFFPGMVDVDEYDKSTATRHRKLILDYLGYCEFNNNTAELRQHARSLIRAQIAPQIIVTRLVEILESNKSEVPSARVLTELVADETTRHEAALASVLEDRLTDTQRTLLDELLEKGESDSSIDPNCQRMKLTLLKRFSQSTKPKKIQGNVDDLRTLRELFGDLEHVIQALDLTREGMRYFASSVIKARVHQVSRRSDDDRFLHLVCFVGHQYYRLQDTLVDTLLACVQTTGNACNREHKDQHFDDRQEQRKSVRQFVQSVDRGAFNPLAQIETIAFNHALADEEKVQQIQNVLGSASPERQIAAEQLSAFKRRTSSNEDAGYFDILESKSVKLQNRASGIVKELEFEDDGSPLMQAITQYKEKNGTLTESAPTDFLEEAERQIVRDASGKFRVSLYKALFFMAIADAIKAGSLNVRHSYKYRSLEDYLIPLDTWKSDREAILERAELKEYEECELALKQLSELLDEQYNETNRRILADENPHVAFRKNGNFVLTTPKEDEDEEREPLRGLFPENRYTSLLEVLSTTNRASGYLDDFRHWQIKHNRQRPQEKTLLAGILGYGCFIGTRKIAKISKPINASELENTVNWYFSLDNINAANDRILAFMDRLNLPGIYGHESGLMHTSSDGQKFDVAVDSLNANYSFKYSGHNKGVSAINFIDCRHFIFHSTVISSGEREAAYVIDGVLHNDVVKSDIHSTDTHGYTEVIFGVTHMLGFTFAPRLKNLKRQQIYSFPHIKKKDYEEQGFRVLPDGYINVKLIEEHWDDILRFVATIKLKETTASQLFKRLNSYSNQHPLYKALKEFGKIIKSIFILKYLNDVEFRQAIEKQLNKGESSNKFSKAVAFGNNQEFLQGEKVEQEIAEGCRRLIKNAVICWNYLYLSQLIAETDDVERRQQIISAVLNGSVVSWQHINLHGEYDFSDEKLEDSVGLQVPKILELSMV